MMRVSMNVSDNDILEANCTVKYDYTIVSGDERFFRMMGENSRFPINRLVHSEDRALFESFLDGGGADPVFVRLQLKNNIYRWVLIGRIKSEEAERIGLTELHIQDILTQSSKFELYFNNVRKYRSFMNLFKEKFFEYDFSTDIICIYFYINGHSEIIERCSLEEWQKRMVSLNYVEGLNVEKFNRMCDDIRGGTDSFSITFQSSILSKGGRRDTLNFRGETICEGLSRRLVVGIIYEMGGRIDDKNILYDIDASKDPATGLLNKKAVTEEIISAITDARQNGLKSSMYLAIIDIDDFKNVNDTYGHYFGDEVIHSFSSVLKMHLGNMGIAGRIGGDEFICLLTGYNDEEEVRGFLKAIRGGLKYSLAQRQRGYNFSVSIGVSSFPGDGDTYEKLFRIADGALYLAKEKGKDRYIIYDEKMHGEIIAEMLRTGRIRGAGFMKPLDKAGMAAELTARLVKHGKSAVDDILKELMSRIDVHGISVYSVKSKKCVLTLGDYFSMPRLVKILNDDKYTAMFDENGVNAVNNVTSFAMDFYDTYRSFLDSKICSSLQISFKQAGGFIGVICFDTFGENRRKWSSEDIFTVYMVVKTIANVDGF